MNWLLKIFININYQETCQGYFVKRKDRLKTVEIMWNEKKNINRKFQLGIKIDVNEQKAK